MKVIFGLFLLIVSFFGTLFFKHYDGTVISYPMVWYILFIVLGFAGLWLFSSSLKKANKIVEQATTVRFDKLKSNSEIISLNIDKCEFKSGSYSHQIDDPNLSSVKLFAPGSLGSIQPKITETVIQSYLTYTETINDREYKFVSQTFPFDPTTLKFYVLDQKVVLYVNRFNHEEYLFDLKR